MKIKNPFSIVNRPEELMALREKLESSLSAALKKRSKRLTGQVDIVPPGVLDALVSASAAVKPAAGRKSDKAVKTARARMGKGLRSALSADVIKAVERATVKASASTVGILDLGAWVSDLPRLLKVMNASQDRLVFFELQTPVPAGLIKTKAPLQHWAEEKLGRKLKKRESGELMRNMLADEFYYFAESVRRRNSLDVVVGLTPAMIAFSESDEVYWNYYAAGKDAVSVVSTCDLREFSIQAGRPYEAAIGMLVATQVFALRNDMDYHDETRGCIFDFNHERAELVKSIQGMRIETGCLDQFKNDDERDVARKLIAALARMKEMKRD